MHILWHICVSYYKNPQNNIQLKRRTKFKIIIIVITVIIFIIIKLFRY